MGCKCSVTRITIKTASDCINRGEYQKAIKLLHGNETVNEGEALYLLGLAYDGLQDLKSAFTYYKKAADLDYPDACYNLAFAYANGRGVTTDMKLAIRYYQKAAESGSDGAWNNLGLLYEKGDGVEVNPKKAFECYNKAYEEGNAYGTMNLGYCYLNGTGVSANALKSVPYFEKAARLLPDDVNVISALANAYVYVSNYDKAAKAMKRAISLGNDHALFTLGVIYFKLERDNEAVKYLKMALDKGEKSAQMYLDIIASENS